MYQPTEKDCVGPNAKYIKLIAADGKGFFVKRAYAVYMSQVIKDVLAGTSPYSKQCKTEEICQITFKDIPSHVLKKECDDINYNGRVKKLN